MKPPFGAITAASFLVYVATKFAHQETEIFRKTAQALLDLLDGVGVLQFSDFATDS